MFNFEEVHATATPGQHDLALLYDFDADDTFYGGPGSQPSWLEEAWAAWAAIDETEEDKSEDSERNRQGINPAPVDWLMAGAGN